MFPTPDALPDFDALSSHPPSAQPVNVVPGTNAIGNGAGTVTTTPTPGTQTSSPVAGSRLPVAGSLSSVAGSCLRWQVPCPRWKVCPFPVAGSLSPETHSLSPATRSGFPVARPVHYRVRRLTDGECIRLSISHRSLTTTLMGSFGRIVIPAPRSIVGDETSSS